MRKGRGGNVFQKIHPVLTLTRWAAVFGREHDELQWYVKHIAMLPIYIYVWLTGEWVGGRRRPSSKRKRWPWRMQPASRGWYESHAVVGSAQSRNFASS